MRLLRHYRCRLKDNLLSLSESATRGINDAALSKIAAFIDEFDKITDPAVRQNVSGLAGHVWKLEMDSVTVSLVSEEMRKKSLESSSSAPNSSTLVSEEGRGRARSKGSFKRDKSRGKSKTKRDLKCYYCDKSGHMKKDC